MKSSITQPGFSLPFSIWFLLALTALLANTLERRLPFWQPISFPADKNCLEECLPASRRAQLPWCVLPGRAVGIPVGTQPHCQGFTGVVIAVCHHDCTGRASPTAGRSLLKSAYKSWLRYENLPELLRCLLWEKNWLFPWEGPVLRVLSTVHLAAKPLRVADTIGGLFSHWGAGSECRLAAGLLWVLCWVLPAGGTLPHRGDAGKNCSCLRRGSEPDCRNNPFWIVTSDGQQQWLPLLVVSLVSSC